MLHSFQCTTFQKPLAHQFRIHRKTWPIEDTRSKAQVCKMFKMSMVFKPSNAVGRLIWETSGEILADFIKSKVETKRTISALGFNATQDKSLTSRMQIMVGL